ncbi:MAG TPA: xanthine dehydrogenase family protein subunit M [Actinomycetota bacterium]|jgi:carbon-monoxide dehydrogenase medium subunit
MLPARFDYHRPETLDEALELMDRFGDEAKVLAGGMSLIPLMKLRFASPANVVDINRIAELSGMSESGGELRVMAVTRNSELETSDLLRKRYPVMAAAAPLISDPIVRNRGTIGGALAHADPAGDWGSVMLALRAQVVARTTSGERVIPIDDLFETTFTTTLLPNEILTEVKVPAPNARSGGAYLKLERKVGDFATVGVAVQLSLDDGHISSAGIGLTAVGTTNVRPGEAEETLVGAEPTEEAFAEAGRRAAAAAEPMTDVRGSAEYKRHVVEVFVRRGLALAQQIAQGS